MPDTAQYTVAEFGQLIKKKYPQYSNLSDEEIGNRVLVKYPEYQELISGPLRRPLSDEIRLPRVDIPQGEIASQEGAETPREANIPYEPTLLKTILGEPLVSEQEIANRLQPESSTIPEVTPEIGKELVPLAQEDYVLDPDTHKVVPLSVDSPEKFLEVSAAKKVAADENFKRLSEQIGVPIENLRNAAAILYPAKEYEFLNEGYVGGFMRGVYESVGEMFNALAGAHTAVQKTLGLPTKVNPFKDVADIYKADKEKWKEVPDNAVGDFLYMAGAIVPDIAVAEFVMPSMAIGTLNRISKGTIKGLPKFATFLGAKYGFGEYEKTQDLTESLKAGAEGFKTGLYYQALGMAGAEVGKIASLVAKDEIIGAATDAIASSMLFGVSGMAESGDWSFRTFLGNAGIGAAFGVSKIRKSLENAATKKMMGSYFTSSKELEAEARKIDKSNGELRKEAISLRQQAQYAEGQDKFLLLTKAAKLENVIGIRTATEFIQESPEIIIDAIRKDETLGPEEKKYYLQKIQDTYIETNEDIQRIRPQVEKIGELQRENAEIDGMDITEIEKDVIKDKNNNRISELEEEIKNIIAQKEYERVSPVVGQKLKDLLAERARLEKEGKPLEGVDKQIEELYYQPGEMITREEKAKLKEETKDAESIRAQAEETGGEKKMVEEEEGRLRVRDTEKDRMGSEYTEEGEKEGKKQEEEIVPPEGMKTDADVRENVPTTDPSNKPPPPPTEKHNPSYWAKKRMRRHGVESNTMQKGEGIEEKTAREIVNEYPQYYRVIGHRESIDKATKFLDDLGGIDRAFSRLLETSSMFDGTTINVARQIAMKYYCGIYANKSLDKSVRDDAFRRFIALKDLHVRELTAAGRTVEAEKLWGIETPEETVEEVMRKTNKITEDKLNEGVWGELGKTRKDLIDELENKLKKTFEEIADDLLRADYIDKIVTDVLKDKATKKPTAGPKESRTQEGIKRAQQRRENAKNKLKDIYSKGGNKLYSTTIPGLTPEAIEAAGEFVASYFEEGYYRTAEAVTELRKYFKESFNTDLTDNDLAKIMKHEYQGKTLDELAKQKDKEAAIYEATRDMIDATKQVVRSHWKTRDIERRQFKDKLIDVGVPEKEAQNIADRILEKFRNDDRMEKVRQKELNKAIGERGSGATKLRTKKNILQKFNEAINLGALDNRDLIDMFSERFGLKRLSDGEAQEIYRLSMIIQESLGKGVFERDAVREMARYIHELYPKSWMRELSETWMHLFYSNILAGASTHALNLGSAGSMILSKPIRDPVNFAKWTRAMRQHVKKEQPDFYNPLADVFYLPTIIGEGLSKGWTKYKEVFRSGDIDNKWIESTVGNEAFSINKGERSRFGRGKPYRPIKIKIKGKEYDINIYNYAKLSGRWLSAEDKLMYTTAYEMELANEVRNVLYKEKGLKGKELRKATLDAIRGRNLAPEVMDAIEAQVENEAVRHEKNFNKSVSNDMKKERRQELILERLKIPEDAQEEIDQIARDNIFTGNRYGLASRLARVIGTVASSHPVPALVLKPIVPFTKVVGNVTEAMLDADPVLGPLRAHGLSVTGILDKATGHKWLGGKTSQKGPIGSRAYYDQMSRASAGAAAFVLLAAVALGTDEDDFIEVTGAFAGEGRKRPGRENIQPKYSFRIGNFWMSYLNIPPLAIPLGLIGNANDKLRTKIGEEDLMDRLKVLISTENIGQTMIMTKDMSFVEGAEKMLNVLFDAVDPDPKVRETAGKRALTQLTKTYTKFGVAVSPTQNNALQQIEKFIDPKSYSQKEIKEVLAYSAGVQFITNYPNIDIFGEPIKFWPGEGMIPYTHWAGLRGKDSRWQFLAYHNAIPAKIYNQEFTVISEYAQRRLEPPEFYNYCVIAGRNFNELLNDYINHAPWWKRAEQVLYFYEEDQKTQLQEDIDRLWVEARSRARSTIGVVDGSYKPRTYKDIRDYPKHKEKSMEEIIGLKKR